MKLKKLIESRGFYVNEREVDSLMDKFDKDRDGKISYSEFIDEFVPKSPSKTFWSLENNKSESLSK